ncbi:MAG TPA: hypothetical protein VJQ45_06605, partial [Ktedonobacterales bacterium]|nr:hypothetical protein [Ktedonobacterales bacterium]
MVRNDVVELPGLFQAYFQTGILGGRDETYPGGKFTQPLARDRAQPIDGVLTKGMFPVMAHADGG